jgi:hypothetical protein
VPLGPSRARISPGSTERLTSVRIVGAGISKGDRFNRKSHQSALLLVENEMDEQWDADERNDNPHRDAHR